ncbi:Uncharacterised protein [Actinobacillus pleuropneumoniae]|nr:Uncharacterised protein [Actinobacillus pleuropneumoniae]
MADRHLALEARLDGQLSQPLHGEGSQMMGIVQMQVNSRIRLHRKLHHLLQGGFDIAIHRRRVNPAYQACSATKCLSHPFL